MTRRPRAVVCLAVALLFGAGCGPLEGATTPAPDFEFPDLDGNLVRLSELQGSVVVIDFWATWCLPCVLQPKELNEVWERHRESGRVSVLGLEVGEATPDEIREWGVDNDAVAEYPLLVGVPESLARSFGVLGFPATVVVAPDGSIHTLAFGVKSAAEIEATIAPLLEP